MEQIRKWSQRRNLRRGYDDGSRSKEELAKVAHMITSLPRLPKRRYRGLSNPDEGRGRLIQQDCSFFTRLPPEIRQLVYVKLFGGQRIHIDLRYAENGTRWDWVSCVCHRLTREVDGQLWELDLDLDECWKDGSKLKYCGTGKCSNEAEKAKRLNGSECKISGLTWLQSCRQAYLESITTLYSTNQFHLSLEPIFALELPSLLLPARRSMIKHLELVLLHTSFGNRDIYWRTGAPIFGEAVACIVETFPNLHTLSLCAVTKPFDFEDYKASYASPEAAMLETIIRPLDGLAKYYEFGRGKKEGVFTVESRHYQEIKQALKVKDDEESTRESWNRREGFWKKVKISNADGEAEEDEEEETEGKLGLERRPIELMGVGYTIISRDRNGQHQISKLTESS